MDISWAFLITNCQGKTTCFVDNVKQQKGMAIHH